VAGHLRRARLEREWAQRAREYLKTEIKRANLTYLMLAQRLVEDGFEETPASIASKLAGGNLTAHFFLASLSAIGHDHLRLTAINGRSDV
jgi:Domain of unknown function (DUF6471)/Flagellar transcriptional activator (FlhD)